MTAALSLQAGAMELVYLGLIFVLLLVPRALIEAHGGTVRTEAAPGTRLKVMLLLARGRPDTQVDSPAPGQAIGL